jgi:hypothetical protein
MAINRPVRRGGRGGRTVRSRCPPGLLAPNDAFGALNAANDAFGA